MNTTNTLESVGCISAGSYCIRFAATNDDRYIFMEDQLNEQDATKEYGTIKEVLEAVTLLLTSQTMREEFFK